MRKKIGISLILATVLLLSACASDPHVPSFEEVVKANESLKVEVPEYKVFKVTGLSSVECQDDICTMSEKDFRISQNDKWNLLQIYKLNHTKDVIRVEAFNTLVDAHSHSELALAKKEAAIIYLETALRKERTYNAVKTWAERLLFMAGIFVFGSL